MPKPVFRPGCESMVRERRHFNEPYGQRATTSTGANAGRERTLACSSGLPLAGFKFPATTPNRRVFPRFLTVRLPGCRSNSMAPCTGASSNAHDERRKQFLDTQGIHQLQFRNYHWKNNRVNMFCWIFGGLSTNGPGVFQWTESFRITVSFRRDLSN